jgi:hypothetical protein
LATSLAIKRELKKVNNNVRILVKCKDGLYAEIKEGMNEDDVLKVLTKRSSIVITDEDFKVGEIIDVYKIRTEDEEDEEKNDTDEGVK